MANNSNMIPIPGRLHSVATDGQVAGANEIQDDAQNKKQSTINSELINAVGSGGSVDSRIADAKAEIIGDAATDYNTLGKLEDKIQAEVSRAEGAESALDGRVSPLETAVGTGGSVDERIAAEGALHYLKSETYNKTEVNGLVSTPHQEYVTVATYASLPASGSTDTIYRVSSYDGANSQVDDTVYSEYAWDGTQYVFLCVKSQIDEVFDITVYNSNTKYADLAAALGVDGANIPATLRRGGMSVKFVHTSDNKYVQYRLMSDSFNTTPANWQGVDDEPTAGSDNLVKSGGVYNNQTLLKNKVYGSVITMGNCDTGFYYDNNGNKYENNIYVRHTDIIPVEEGDIYSYNLYVTSFCRIVAFNSEKQVLINKSVLSSDDERGIYKVSSGVSYIQAFNDSDAAYDDNYIKKEQSLKHIIDINSDNINSLIQNVGYYESSADYVNGNAYTTDGVPVKNDYIKCGEIVPVSTGEVWKCKLSIAAGYLTVAAFDTDFNILLDKCVSGNIDGTYEVQSGVAYIWAFCSDYTNDGYLQLNGIKELKEDNLSNKEKITSLEEQTLISGSYYFNIGGYIHSDLGQVVEHSGYKCTDYLYYRPSNDIVTKNLVYDNQYGVTAIAYYDKDKNYISSVKNIGSISAYTFEVANIPSDTVYIRMSCLATNVAVASAQYFSHISVVLQKMYEDIMAISSKKQARTTKTLCGFDVLGMSASHMSISQAEYDESVQQIKSNNGTNDVGKMKYELTFKPTSNNCFMGVGIELRTVELRLLHTFEFRVNGTAATIRTDGDWCGGVSTIVTNEQLPFEITNGSLYTIGFERLDGNIIDNEKKYGVRVFCSNSDRSLTYEKIIERDWRTAYNGIAGESIAGEIAGDFYVSLKQGSADVINLNLSSDYNTKVKVAITGDSFVNGGTLLPNLNNRYCELIEDVVGMNNMVIDGIGGFGVDSGMVTRILNICNWFHPDYYIIAMGTNNSDYDSYHSILSWIAEKLTEMGIYPILVTVTPTPSNQTFREAANNWVRTGQYRYVDVCAAVTEDDDSTWKDGYVFQDNVHPSAIGHQAIFEAFCKEIPELFE